MEWGGQKGFIYSQQGICPTIPATTWKDPIKFLNKGRCDMDKDKIKQVTTRIRKLTPTECWGLMGLTLDDCQKAKAVGVSNSQLYKQAGNGIVTNCVELLMEHLYKAQYDDTYICTDENFYLTAASDNSPAAANRLIISGVLDKPKWIETRRRVYSPCGICPTLHGIGCGGNNEPKIIENSVNKQEL